MQDYIVHFTDGTQMTITAATIADVYALCYDMGIDANEIASVARDE